MPRVVTGGVIRLRLHVIALSLIRHYVIVGSFGKMPYKFPDPIVMRSKNPLVLIVLIHSLSRSFSSIYSLLATIYSNIKILENPIGWNLVPGGDRWRC